MSKKKYKVFELAKAQLETAIMLFLTNKKISAITLAGACDVILCELVNRKGRKNWPRPPLRPTSHHAALREATACKAGLGANGSVFIRYSNKSRGFSPKNRCAAVV